MISLFLAFVVLCFISLIILIKHYKIKNNNLAILFIILCVIFNVLYWKVKNQCDNCIIGKNKRYSGILFGGCFEIFHVLHILFWFIIGLLAPNHYTLVIIVSVIWELFEHIYFKSTGLCTDLFCGRVEDIFTNVIAYALGSYMSS